MSELPPEINAELDPDKIVGENIQRFRKAKGMTQTQLAETLTEFTGQTVHQQTILKIEKGTRPLRYSEARSFADALNVPLEALSEGTETSERIAHIVEERHAIDELDKELHRLGEQMAYRLNRLAVSVSLNQEFGGESDGLRFLVKQSQQLTLRYDWGAELNRWILLSLSQQPYLAHIKPKFKADNYIDVLAKVAETPVRHWDTPE